jgi:hypothetical protein
VSDWFGLRTQAQRDIHAAFAVRGLYTDATVVEPVELAVRWHSRFGLPLVFSRAELAEKGLTMRRGGKVALTDYNYTFGLDVREPNTGPVNEVWTVAN